MRKLSSLVYYNRACINLFSRIESSVFFLFFIFVQGRKSIVVIIETLAAATPQDIFATNEREKLSPLEMRKNITKYSLSLRWLYEET